MSTCFETEGSSSGKCKKFYHTCTYNRLPEDEPSGSKHVEDMVKIKIYIIYIYIYSLTVHFVVYITLNFKFIAPSFVIYMKPKSPIHVFAFCALYTRTPTYIYIYVVSSPYNVP